MNKHEKIKLVEELAANAHVALNSVQFDGWILRFSEGHTGRANSISVIYPSSFDVEQKIPYCEEMYAKQNLPCIFKLTDGNEELNDILNKRGYQVITPTDVCFWDISDINMPEGDIEFFDKAEEEWLSAYFKLEGFGEKQQNIYRRMIEKVFVNQKYVAIKENGEIIAVASLVSEGDQMLLHNVVVDKNQRGKGYGRKVCNALLAKAKECGIKTCWLQVVIDNVPAYKLYESIGFKKEYTYWYMRKES